MRRWRLWAGLAGVSCIGFCWMYVYCRRPVVIERRHIEGAEVEIIGRRNHVMPGIDDLDMLLWRKYLTPTQTELKDGRIRVTINRIPMENTAWEIEESWERYEDNHKRCVQDEGCMKLDEKLFMLLRYYPLFVRIDKYIEAKMDLALIHERQHVRDNVTDFDQLDSEVRAELAELIYSKSALACSLALWKLEGMSLKTLSELLGVGGKYIVLHADGSTEKRNVQPDEKPWYRLSARRILEGLKTFPDYKPRDLRFPTRRETERMARILADRWYPKRKI